MSQMQKRDIVSFFKPYSRMLPQKRPASDFEDEDTIVVQPVSITSPPRTPPRYVQQKHAGSSGTWKTPRSHKTSPLKTPRSDRTVSIPFRTPLQDRLDPHTGIQSKANFEEEDIPNFSPSKCGFSFEFPDPIVPNQKTRKNEGTTEIRDSEDDETSSLESLADIFDRNKKDDTTSNSSPPENSEEARDADRSAMLRMHSGGYAAPIVGKQKLRQLFARGRETKFDLSRVLDDHFEDQETEKNIAHARKEYENFTQEYEKAQQSQLDKSLLASMVQNENDGIDNVSRLLSAVDRTEALSKEKSFSFFDSRFRYNLSGKLAIRQPIPQDAIPSSLWTAKDLEAQSRAFLSGVLADRATTNSLSEEVIRWAFENIIKEPRDDLRQAYVRCVEAASPRWTRTNLTASDINLLFQNLNADTDALRDRKAIEPNYRRLSESCEGNSKYLVAALELLRLICQDVDFTVLSKLCSVISRLSLDTKVMSDGVIAQAVEELLRKLCDLPEYESRSHVQERILSDLSQNLHDPALQAKFLCHVLPMSPNAASLRVSLARTFLLGTEHDVKDSSKILTELTGYIAKSQHFSMSTRLGSDSVDYPSLSSRIQLLDIAIGDGCRPETFATSQDEFDFNASVDKLVDCLHEIFVSIADTGASHMRRTEAKDALQALEYRVLYSVRTKPRRKKHVFDSETGKAREAEEYDNEIKSKNFMAKFLKR